MGKARLARIEDAAAVAALLLELGYPANRELVAHKISLARIIHEA